MHTKNDATNGREDIVTSISDPELKSGSLPFHSHPNPPPLSSKFWHFPHKPLAFLNIFALKAEKALVHVHEMYRVVLNQGDTLHVIVRLVYRLFFFSKPG
jgi:hypothetical protein